MSQTSKDELLKAVQPRCRPANRTEKQQMLDENRAELLRQIEARQGAL